MTAYDNVHREAMQDRADDPPEPDYDRPGAGDDDGMCTECGAGLELEEIEGGMCRRCYGLELEADAAFERRRDGD